MSAVASARTAPEATRDRPALVLVQRCGDKDCGAKGCGQVDAEAVPESGHDFASLRVQALRESESAGPEGVEVGPMDHPLEREADRAAEQVASAFSPGAGAGLSLSRIGSFGAGAGGLQAWPSGTRSPAGPAPGAVQQVLGSAGRPLDPAARDYFEPRFGHDFSQVRIHADAQAAQAADAISARAFTAGQHIVFGAGSYRPEVQANRKLLAHELTHTIQQSAHVNAIHGGAAVQRTPADQQSPEPGELSEANPQDSPRYIDTLFESVSGPTLMFGVTTFFWTEGGVEKNISIPLVDLDQDDKRNPVALFKIHATKEEALKTVESWRKSTPGFAFYSFYRSKDGVIMPTTFSLRSAPLFHALWPKLKEDRAQQAAEYARGWGKIANSINPIPCTHVDDNGELRWAINFGNCALPIALHGYNIHSSRAGSVPPGESPPRTPPRDTAPPRETTPPRQEPAAPKQEPAQPKSPTTETAPAGPKPAMRTPAQLERHLEQLGLSSDHIRGLAGGQRRGQFSEARAALIERLLSHFTPEDMKALGQLLADRKLSLDRAAVDGLIKELAPGQVGEWVKELDIAQAHGEATRLPPVEGAREDSLSAEQDPNARTSTTKNPSPGPEPRPFRRGNFAHRFAEHILDAIRLPRPNQAEVVVELQDGTGDIIRTDRIVSHADRGELFEIKPAGRSAEIGRAQLPGRLEALQREFPKPNGWTGQVVEYTPAQVRAWLQREAQAARATGAPVPDIDAIMKLLGF